MAVERTCARCGLTYKGTPHVSNPHYRALCPDCRQADDVCKQRMAAQRERSRQRYIDYGVPIPNAGVMDDDTDKQRTAPAASHVQVPADRTDVHPDGH